MLEKFNQPDVMDAAGGQQASDVATMAADLASKKWDELVLSNPTEEVLAEAAKMTDAAWEAYGPESPDASDVVLSGGRCTVGEYLDGASQAVSGFVDTAAPHFHNAVDAVADGATDVAYVGASGALGAASFFEGAVDAVPVWVDVALGRREEAEGLLEEQFFHGLMEPLQESLNPSEAAVQAGEAAFNMGATAAGAATIGVATTAAATSAPAVATVASATAALGVAGEVLHQGYEEDGELSDETVAASGVAAVVTVLGIALGAQALSETAPEATPEATGEITHIHTINEGLAGDVHPVTGVPFNEVQVTLPSGEVIEGVFPEFESVIGIQLPEELYEASNYTQFQSANQALYDALQGMPELQHVFNPDQLLQIADGVFTGQAPDGFVWHHNEQVGLLQLVDSAIHAATGHTGGQAIWGAAHR